MGNSLGMIARVVVVLACSCAAALPVGAEEFISVDEIERGMSGFGLTVVEGTDVDTFQVEVLDVMHGRASSGDIILVRVSGLGTELTGIAQGMSGSPVYLDGRLAGALAFAYSFAMVPIGGVTPIKEMMELIEREEMEESISDRSTGMKRLQKNEGFSQGPGRISTPIAVSGFAPEVAGEIDSYFDEMGMVTTLGGSGSGSNEETDWKAVPGAGVGVRLLSGDANLTAIGTITYVDGDNILAFGHPLFQSGGVDFPLVSVEVHTVLPSRSISFKIGSPLETIGSMVQDRRTAIAGRIGKVAPTIPISVSVEVPGIRSDRFEYQALDHRALTPALAAWATRNSIAHREKIWGEGTVRMTVDLDLKDHENLHIENLYSSYGFVGQASSDAALPIQVLANTNLGDVRLNRIDIAVEVTDGRSSGRIEELRLEKGTWRPGEDLRGAFTMRRHRGGMVTVPIEIPLPGDLPDGKLLLRVCDASSSEEWDDKRAPNRFRARSVDGLVRLLEDLRTNDKVYCQLFDDATGATIRGKAMPRLPGSVLSIYSQPLHDDDGAYRKGSVVAAKEYPFDFVVSGCRALPVTIDRTAPQRRSTSPEGE